MIKINTHLNSLWGLPVILLLVFAGSACTISPPVSAEKTGIQAARVTQLATVLVTQDVTQEVTRVIEIPVTVTPAGTPISTLTPAPASPTTGSTSLTLAPDLPEVFVLEHSDCMYGPGTIYLYKYSVFPDNPMEALGRNMDGSWIYIQNLHGWNPCWIQATLVKLASGDFNGLPIVYSKLPFDNEYNPPNAIARRDGNEVTISWKAIWMSLDEYRGYLIEALVCQGGTQVFDPISYFPPLAGNTGTLSVKVIDESGCPVPSSAQIYSAQRQGYSFSALVPWPPHP